jgi:WD40 repeat protein
LKNSCTQNLENDRLVCIFRYCCRNLNAMGVSFSSSQQPPEGEHFNQLVNPGKKDGGSAKLKGSAITARAKVLKRIAFDTLWENFLNGAAESFALTQAEVSSIILESIPPENMEGVKLDKKLLEKEVKDYIALVEEFSPKETSKTVDFMSLCSSVLLLSEISIEIKADKLFSWIALDPESSAFSFDDFFVAMRSIERGLSHAMGHPSCSDDFVRSIATQWMALADPHHKGSTDAHTRVASEHFFEFCTNRQHVVRRLLESLSALPVLSDENTDTKEVADTLDAKLSAPPAGGDEWMANPAWKKTAERMVPAAAKAALARGTGGAKPASSLALDWVHGYRGFDCRNNLAFADPLRGSQIIYSAAALGIVQETAAETETEEGGGRNTSTSAQAYFGEHGDDVLCLTTISVNGKTLVASGEIGKKPAIYLYSWQPTEEGKAGTTRGFFTSLACMKGAHTKGVTQLAFSPDGCVLFTVGVDYTVAVYDTQEGSKTFGKLMASSQGPKSKVMHVASMGGGKTVGKNTNSGYMFVSCGEKHALTWTLANGALKQAECKLGAYRNKMILCAAYLSETMAVLGTSEGDLAVVNVEGKVVAAAIKGSHSHGSKSINALWSNPTGSVVASGDRDGKVIVWQASVVTVKEGSTANLIACADFTIHGYSKSAIVEGGLNMPSATAAAAGGGGGGGGKGKGKAGAKSGGGKVAAGGAGGGVKAPKSCVPSVRAVALSEDCTKLVVGTSTCEVLQFSLPGGASFAETEAAAVAPGHIAARALVCGHFEAEVWGLAVRPTLPREQLSADGAQLVDKVRAARC